MQNQKVSKEIKREFLEKLGNFLSMSDTEKAGLLNDPLFKELSIKFIDVIFNEIHKLNKKNEVITDAIIAVLESIRVSLMEQKNKTDLSMEELNHIIDKEYQLAQIYMELDQRNKEHLRKVWLRAGIIVAVLALSSGLGIWLLTKNNSSDKDEDDTININNEE
jgi:hypothetical protein